MLSTIALEPYNSLEAGTPVLWKKKLGLSWGKGLAQGPTAGKWQIQVPGPGLLDCKAYANLLWKP